MFTFQTGGEIAILDITYRCAAKPITRIHRFFRAVLTEHDQTEFFVEYHKYFRHTCDRRRDDIHLY